MKNRKLLIAGAEFKEAKLAQSDSYSALRSKVSDAIMNNIRAGVDMDCDNDGVDDRDKYAYVEDLYPSKVVYSMSGCMFACDYSVADGAVTLGTPQKVELSYTTVGEARVMCREAVTFKEAAYDAATGKLTMTVIKPGFNTSKSRFYKESALRKGAPMFSGAKMFVNHQTEAESKQRPEGDVNQWVANIQRTWNEADGTMKAEAVVIDPPFKQKLATLAENGLLHEMGVSIRAAGQQYRDTIDGVDTNVVESFVACRSVDFVTYPGAGGRVEVFEASRDDANDVDLVTAEAFETRRPDIVSVFKNKFMQEMNVEKTVEQLNTELTEAKRVAADAIAKLQESERKERKATASVELTKLLTESKLPVKAQDRLRKQFAEAEKADGMKEAIVEEQEYIKSITGGKVVNMGEAHTGTGEDDEKKIDLVKTFQETGLTKEQAEIAARGL